MKKIMKQLRTKRFHFPGIFHDSRADVIEVAGAVNVLIVKVNEIIDEINKIKMSQETQRKIFNIKG